MKYDLNKPLTKGAARTLKSFSDAMFDMLATRNFDSVSVGELCKAAEYPRATFYNYFEDKYDLLNYCWERLAQELHLEDYRSIPSREIVYVFFNRLFDFLQTNRSVILSILKNNTFDEYVFRSFRAFLNEKIRAIFLETSGHSEFQVPWEILADHYSNTLVLLGQQCCFGAAQCDRDTALRYLDILLGSVNAAAAGNTDENIQG